MQILNESPVLESEIDRLGHMNVQHYMERVGRAGAGLLSAIGLTPDWCARQNVLLRQTDLYCRFHREQFAGATLQVLGGLVDFNEQRARHYFEIRNPAAEQVAATFIIEHGLVTLAERKATAIPAGIAKSVPAPATDVPAYGRPRSLTLEAPRLDVTLAELDGRIVDLGVMGMMSGRFDRAVDASECDQHGYLREGANLMFGGKRPELDEDGSYGPPVLVTDEGHRFGWAIMETRSMILAAPRAGDRLMSIGADIALAPKSRHSRRWTFDTSTNELLGINDAVAVALDLDERRAIDIPPSVRRIIDKNYLPEYA